MDVPAAMNVGSIEYWVGNGCDSATVRQTTTTTQCENVQRSYPNLTFPPYQCFTTLGSNCTSPYQNVPIPAGSLFKPTMPLQCGTISTATNDVFIVVTPQGTDPSMAGICKMNLNESVQGPSPVDSISAGSGDSAITLSWTPAVAGSAGNPVDSFQILCANADGSPVAGKMSSTLAYSICVGGAGGNIFRRNTILGGSVPGGTDDAGTGSTVDLLSEPLLGGPLIDNSWLSTQAVPADGGGDGGTIDTTAILTLNPMFTCSDQIKLGGTSYSTRITGLTNNSQYQFVVLSIDAYGNATPSPVLIATPIPTEDLWRRWYHDTGYSPGFCTVSNPLFIAGDALLVVLAIAWVASRRRRA
jgi:hypothetical protein